MSSEKWYCKVIIHFCVIIIIPIVVVACFTVGGIYMNKEGMKIFTYAKTTCHIKSKHSYPNMCGSGRYQYTCYGMQWIVYHEWNETIEVTIHGPYIYGNKYDPEIEAIEYQINSKYSCWYNIKNPMVVQWNEPNFICFYLFICGGILTLVEVIYMGVNYLRKTKSEL